MNDDPSMHDIPREQIEFEKRREIVESSFADEWVEPLPKDDEFDFPDPDLAREMGEEMSREISFGPVANPDGSPTEFTKQMLAGTGRDPDEFARSVPLIQRDREYADRHADAKNYSTAIRRANEMRRKAFGLSK